MFESAYIGAYLCCPANHAAGYKFPARLNSATSFAVLLPQHRLVMMQWLRVLCSGLLEQDLRDAGVISVTGTGGSS
jgi:hypothetical protein